MEKKMNNSEVVDSKDATTVQEQQQEQKQEHEQDKSESLTEEEKVIRKEVERLLQEIEEVEEEEEEEEQQQPQPQPPPPPLTLQDDSEKSVVVVVEEEEVKEEAPQVTRRKFEDQPLSTKDEVGPVMTREPDTRRKSQKLSWVKPNNLTPLKHEVDKLMVVEEEEEEEEEEDDNVWGSTSDKVQKSTLEKRKPLMLSAGYLSWLYKTASQCRQSKKEKKRHSVTAELGDRFFRLSKQLILDLREHPETKRPNPILSPKLNRFARLAKMFTLDSHRGSQSKQKTAEFRKWDRNPRLSRPLKKIVIPTQDLNPKKEEDPTPDPRLQHQKQTKPKKRECDSFFAFSGLPSNVWSMGQRISHWRLAHHRGYHIDSFTQDKDYKHKLIRHEQEVKTSVPLPFQDVIEEEALIILMETLYDYQTKLGQYHPLTIQLEDQVDKLHLQLQARGVWE